MTGVKILLLINLAGGSRTKYYQMGLLGRKISPAHTLKTGKKQEASLYQSINSLVILLQEISTAHIA